MVSLQYFFVVDNKRSILCTLTFHYCSYHYKMDLEAPDAVVVEASWRFSIPNPEPLGRPIISIDDVWFDYVPVDEGTGVKKPKAEWILQLVNFGVDLDSRIGILG